MLFMFLRYVFCCSYTHNVAPKGKFIAFVSAEAETDNPQSELRPGIDLLGPVDELFFDMYDRFEPVNEPSLDNCFVSSVSYTLYENTVVKSHILDVHVSFFLCRVMMLLLTSRQLCQMFLICTH